MAFYKKKKIPYLENVNFVSLFCLSRNTRSSHLLIFISFDESTYKSCHISNDLNKYKEILDNYLVAQIMLCLHLLIPASATEGICWQTFL